MAEKRIRISVDDDVSSRMQRIGENTEKAMRGIADSYAEMDDLLSEMIRDSENQNKTIQERIRLIEKEISLQEKDARIYQTDRRQRLDHEKRLGQEKGRWSKEDENMYRRRKTNMEIERRDENLYYQMLRHRFSQMTSGMTGATTGGGMHGFEDRFSEYLHDASRLDRNGGGGGNGNDDDDGSNGGGGNGNDDDDGSNGGGGRRRQSRIVSWSRQAGNGALAAAGFGAVLSIAGFVGKMIDESRQLDENRNRLTGTTGKQIVGGAAYGLKESSLMEYARNVAISRGTAANGGKEARDQLALEKGFGMDIGSTNQFNKVLRASDSTLVDATLGMLNIMKKSDLYNIKRGDFSQLHELMERSNSLNELQASHQETIEAYKTSAIMAALGKVGGSFGDFRQTNTIQSINGAITNPNNDFKQAFLFRALRDQNPNASFLDLKMKQEEGIFGKGTIGGVMKNLSNTFQGDQLTFSISKMLGLNLHQAKRLQEHYSTNPSMFDDMTFENEEDFKKYAESGFSRKSIQKRGDAHTGTIERWVSKFDTKMGRAGDKAVKYVEGLEQAYDKGGFSGLMSKIGEDIVNAIKTGLKEGWDTITGRNAPPTGQGSTVDQFATGEYTDYDDGGKVKKGLRMTSQYNAMKFGSDIRRSLQQVPEEELSRYSALQGNIPNGYGAFNGVAIDPLQQHRNSGKAKEFNEQLLDLLNRFNDNSYKMDEYGKIMKVEVVNGTNQPKNTTYKPTSDN